MIEIEAEVIEVDGHVEFGSRHHMEWLFRARLRSITTTNYRQLMEAAASLARIKPLSHIRIKIQIEEIDSRVP